MSLSDIIDQYGAGPIAYDLGKLGVDLRGVFSGEVSPRYILMLLQHSEEGSAFVSAVRGNSAMQGWTIEALLLRVIANHSQIASWQRSGGKNSSRPKEIELPTQEKPKRVARVADLKKALQEKENIE